MAHRLVREAEFEPRPLLRWGAEDEYHIFTVPGLLDSTSEDWRNTPVTTLRRGLALGRVTATGRLKPVRRVLVRADAPSTATTFNLGSDAAAFKVGDPVRYRKADGSIGPTTPRTVTAVSATGITIDSAFGVALVANQDQIFVADGSERCVGLLGSTVSVRDRDGNLKHESVEVIRQVFGIVNSAQVPNYDAVVAADLAGLIDFGF